MVFSSNYWISSASAARATIPRKSASYVRCQWLESRISILASSLQTRQVPAAERSSFVSSIILLVGTRRGGAASFPLGTVLLRCVSLVS